MTKLLSYQEKDTWIHRLCGVTKLLFFLLWCITSALTYDTRILAAMIAISLALFAMSKTEWKQVAGVYQCCEIYGSHTVLFQWFAGHDVTAEELFYLLNVVMKYFTIAPSIFIFMVTTDPSEFAASLSRVGVPYMASYSVAIALRYIPDVQGDFRRIRNAQEARGIEMSGKAKLKDRITRTASIIFPLLFSSMEHISVVSNAMELRGFGKKKTRTWYAQRKLQAGDYIVLALSVVFTVIALVITFHDGSRFYNPFAG